MSESALLYTSRSKRGAVTDGGRPGGLPASAGNGEVDSPLAPLLHVNERCLTLLAEAARREAHCTSPLVIALRRPLLAMTPESRARACRRALLLIDMAFRVRRRSHRKEPIPVPVRRSSYPPQAPKVMAIAPLALPSSFRFQFLGRGGSALKPIYGDDGRICFHADSNPRNPRTGPTPRYDLEQPMIYARIVFLARSAP